MQFNRRIAAIEKRAAKLNLSLPEVCVDAGVRYSTVWRWRQPGANPKHATLESVFGKLEACLSKKEADLRRALARQASRPAA